MITTRRVASSKLTTDGAKGGYPLPMCFGSIYPASEFLPAGRRLNEGRITKTPAPGVFTSARGSEKAPCGYWGGVSVAFREGNSRKYFNSSSANS
jgi:hypothetical protein